MTDPSLTVRHIVNDEAQACVDYLRERLDFIAEQEDLRLRLHHLATRQHLFIAYYDPARRKVVFEPGMLLLGFMAEVNRRIRLDPMGGW